MTIIRRLAIVFVLVFLLPGNLSANNPLPESVPAKDAPAKGEPANGTVLVLVAKGLDVQLDALARTIGGKPQEVAFWKEWRQELTQIFSADGPDFQRSFGVMVQTNGRKLWPLYFAPMKEHSNRLNNIVLFPQIYQPVQDEYGPTKRYRIRQDIPVLGAAHLFFWPFEPLFAEERNGWLMVTVADQFEYLPKELPPSSDRSFRLPKSDELLFARLDGTALPPDLAAGLLTLAKVLLLDAPNAPFGKAEKETKEKLGQFLSGCRQGLRDTTEITLALEQDKATDFLLTCHWRVKPETSTGKWFVSQKGSPLSLADRIQKRAFPFPAELDLLLPGKLRAISDVLTLSTAKIISAEQSAPSESGGKLSDRFQKPLLSGTVHFTAGEATITLKLNSVFMRHMMALAMAEEEQLQKEKQKEKPPQKAEDFDIVF